MNDEAPFAAAGAFDPTPKTCVVCGKEHHETLAEVDACKAQLPDISRQPLPAPNAHSTDSGHLPGLYLPGL